VFIDEDTQLFTGYIDRLSPSKGMVKIQARSKTADLIESCPIVTTGEFKKRNTQQIITALCDPFGVVVSGEEGIAIDKYNVELDSRCSEIIAELCVLSSVIATTSITGDLVLSKYDPDIAYTIVGELEEGVNCNIVFAADARKMASRYSVLGQGSFIDGDNTELAHHEVGTFPRTKQATAISPVSTNAQMIRTQVAWFKRAYEASGEILKITLPGMRKIYKGEHITITSASCKIEQGTRLIESVRYVQEADTTYTELVVVPPAKYGGKDVELSGWLL